MRSALCAAPCLLSGDSLPFTGTDFSAPDPGALRSMGRGENMAGKQGWVQVLIAGTAAMASAGGSLAADAPTSFVRIKPADITWTPAPGGHGAKFAVLLGDPSKPGIYVMRAYFPPHVMDAPHTHENDRYVTVVQGIWYTGTGVVFDLSKAVPLPPGSVMFHPANAPHWDGSAGDEPVVVQIVGEGPAPSVPVDPNAAPWIEVALPSK